MFHKNVPKTLGVLAFFLLVPVAEASHQSYGVDRNDLDDEIVEEFPIPVLFGVELEDLVPDFGDPRGGGTRSHEGQDMRAPQSTPVVSPTEAIVISSGVGSNAGKFVYTANPGGETFRYMHLDEIADFKRGDKLDVGDFIGTVGDTGNAPDGVYHLHFEVRNKKNKPTDPHERFGEDAFSGKEKMSFLKGIFRDIKKEDEYAEFLVETFRSDFAVALDKGYSVPNEIEDFMKDSGMTSQADLLTQLDKLITSIPNFLPSGLSTGDQGVGVSLLQTFLIFKSEGESRDQLALAGSTGYYGPITSNAMMEYQVKAKLETTGLFDEGTQAVMVNLSKR